MTGPATHPPSGPSTPPPPPGPKNAHGSERAAMTSPINASALLAEADRVLHDLKTPARRDPLSAAVGANAIATPGGPVTFSLPPTPAAPRFEAEALAQLIAATCECFACTLPDGMPPFPGSPPGPPPTS